MAKKGSEIKEELGQLFSNGRRVVVSINRSNKSATTYIPDSILEIEGYTYTTYRKAFSIDELVKSANGLREKYLSSVIDYIICVSDSTDGWQDLEFHIDILDVNKNRHHIKTFEIKGEDSIEEQLAYNTSSMLLEIVKNNNDRINKINKERMMNKADLHVHSNGTEVGCGWISEIINDAIYYKLVDTIAITDQDSVTELCLRGASTVEQYIRQGRIELINGVEMTATPISKDSKFHILGLDIDIRNKDLNNKLDEIRLESIYRFISVVMQLKKEYKLNFKLKDIETLIHSGRVLRDKDIAILYFWSGYAKTTEEAYQKYLNPNIGIWNGIPYQECLDIIIKSGGIPILAHPKSLNLGEKEFLKLLRDMIDNGLRGIEAYHSTHTKEEMDYYRKIAEEHGLLISGGSGYRGANLHFKPSGKALLGTGIDNNLCLRREDLTVLDEIEKRKSKR